MFGNLRAIYFIYLFIYFDPLKETEGDQNLVVCCKSELKRWSCCSQWKIGLVEELYTFVAVSHDKNAWDLQVTVTFCDLSLGIRIRGGEEAAETCRLQLLHS